MAVNMHKKYTESLTREWVVPSGTKAGDLVIHATSGQVGVALTDRGNATGDANVPGITGGTVPTGGVGNKDTAATVAVDGSWRFEIDGANDGETVSGTGTAAGTTVYGSTDPTKVLLSDADSVGAVGVIDDCNIVEGVGAILIGAVL